MRAKHFRNPVGPNFQRAGIEPSTENFSSSRLDLAVAAEAGIFIMTLCSVGFNVEPIM